MSFGSDFMTQLILDQPEHGAVKLGPMPAIPASLKKFFLSPKGQLAGILDTKPAAIPDAYLGYVSAATGAKYDAAQGKFVSDGKPTNARNFKDKAATKWIAELFDAIVKSAKSKIALSLDKYDLFHFHLFFDATHNLCGALFHAREYPRGKEDELGPCCHGSTAPFDKNKYRNILWLAGTNAAWLIDADNADIAGNLLMANPYKTVDEENLGKPFADVSFFRAGKTNHVFVAPTRTL